MSSDNIEVHIPKELTLLQLFASLLETVPMNLTVSINPSAFTLLKVILEKMPSALVEPFENIIKDGKLTNSDIPNIVLLISNLHNEKFNELYESNITSDSIFDLIQLLVHSLIDSEYVKVDNKEAMYAMLDLSISLLKMRLNISVPDVYLRRCC